MITTPKSRIHSKYNQIWDIKKEYERTLGQHNHNVHALPILFQQKTIKFLFFS